MKLPPISQVTRDHLVLWVIHRFGEEFENHALLKGGMQLALLSSQRQTNDIDYTFVPFNSKKEILPKIDRILNEIEGAFIEKNLHSTAGRYVFSLGKASIQIEFNVKIQEKSTTISTQLLAKKLGELPQIIRVMDPSVALAHKIAAWNERRLLRDLYDIYYWYAIIKVSPDVETLKSRLSKFQSRLPHLKSRKKMTTRELASQLEAEVENLDESQYLNDLSPLIPISDLQGSFLPFKTQLTQLAQKISILKI